MTTIASIEAEPLSVPLREPFVIASATVTTTRAALVRVTLDDGTMGIGEAATLYPVTKEDQSDLFPYVARSRARLVGAAVELAGLPSLLDDVLPDSPVTRAGVEGAILDALARRAGRSVRELLGGPVIPPVLVSDVTIPILPLETMCSLAEGWRARGFQVFKVKVGKDLDADLRALGAIAKRVPDARFRIDANGGFSAREALHLVSEAKRLALVIECFEEPTTPFDLDAMAAVSRACTYPVVADESVKTLAHLESLLGARAATGVNLKLAKSGGLLAALAIGRHAMRHGLSVMMGGMVETRLGMTEGAHVAAALGGVAFVDLDTAMLLAEDPFEGGYEARGAELHLATRGAAALGFGVRWLTSSSTSAS